MPTYDRLEPFIADFAALTPAERAEFRRAVRKFIADLKRGRFRAGLNIHDLDGYPGIFSLSWGEGGGNRALFEYGEEIHPGQPHIIWRRVGTHVIYRRP